MFSKQIGRARFRAPEVLFRPDLLGEECEGIHEVLTYSIQKSDLDLRKMLYQNIVLSGGSTLFKGFGDRLLSELKKCLPKDTKIRVRQSETITQFFVVNKFLCVFFCIDLCATGTPLLHMDGRLDSRFARHLQEDVDLEEGVRRRGSSGDSQENVLNEHRVGQAFIFPPSPRHAALHLLPLPRPP